MRVIGTLTSDATTARFSHFLTHRGIENRFDSSVDAASGQTIFQIWILDEDHLEEASELFKQFANNPFDPTFDIPVQQDRIEEVVEETPVRKQYISWVTYFFLSLCVFVYLFDLALQYPVRQDLSEEAFAMTPVESALLFDLPPFIERLAFLFEAHKIQPDQKIADLTPAVQAELATLMKTPYWRGVYDWIVMKIKTGDATPAEGPLFIKIREGQIWRLFSPCLLHRDLLHILFNMIWLWVLGRPIEQRIGAWRTLFLTLFVAVVSNTVQYLMSGPFFLGYSGVVMGLAGFIWMRQRMAPWEGYPLQRATILFLGFFVLAMFVLQALSFIVQLTTNLPFILNIANSAHIVGALAGALLGRFSYFAWRVK